MNNEKEIYTEWVLENQRFIAYLYRYFITRSSIIGLNYKKIPNAKHAFEHLLDWIMADIIDVIPL